MSFHSLFDDVAIEPPVAPRSLGRTLGRIAHKAICVALSMVLVVETLPAAAQQAIVGAAGMPGDVRPFVDQTYNGMPKINIVGPNGAGVSHNLYERFNIDGRGLILNNSAIDTQTGLAGWTEGNPNLRLGGEARVIVNEVTGASDSKLEGPLEVGGRKADVIVANPNGLTCNGCGFVNTGRATLTTGRPVFGADGSLERLRVEEGTLIVGPGGLDARGTERMDLLARAMAIRGEIRAETLNLVAGANDIRWDTLDATPIAGKGAVPALAIDVAALGGMYAKAIRMVATERGVGVNMAGDMASAGDLVMSSGGALGISGRVSGGKVAISAKGRTAISGKVQSGGALGLVVEDALELPGSLAAPAGEIRAVVAGDAIVSGDVTADAVTMRVGGRATLASVQRAARDWHLVAGELINEGAIAGTTVTLEVAGTLDNRWKILAAEKMEAVAGTLANQGVLHSNGDLAVLAAGIANTGTLSASGQAAITTVDLRNFADATIAAGGGSAIEATGTVFNAGRIGTGGNLVLRAHDLGQTAAGTMRAEGRATIAGLADAAGNRGFFRGQGTIVGAALEIGGFATLDLSGALISTRLTDGGPAPGAMRLSAGRLAARGAVFDGDAAVDLIAAGDADLDGAGIAGRTVSLTVGGVLSAPDLLIAATATASVAAAGSIDLTRATVRSGEGLAVTATAGGIALTEATLIDPRAVFIDGRGPVVLDDLRLWSGGAVSVISGDLLARRAGIEAHGALGIAVAGSADVASARLVAAGDLSLSVAGHLGAADAVIATEGVLTLATGGDLTARRARLLSLGDAGRATIVAGGRIDLDDGLIELHSPAASVAAGSIALRGGAIRAFGGAGGELTVSASADPAIASADGVIRLGNGIVQSDGDLTIRAGALVAARDADQTTTPAGADTIAAAGRLIFVGDRLTVGADARLLSGGDLVVAATGAVDIAGTVSAGRVATVGAGSLTVDGTLGGGALDLVIGGATTITATGRLDSRSTLSLDTGSFSQVTGLWAPGDLRLRSAGAVDIASLILSGGDLTIHAPSFANHGGWVWAAGSIRIAGHDGVSRADSVFNDSGLIEAHDGDLVIAAQSVTNLGTRPTVRSNDLHAVWYQTDDGIPMLYTQTGDAFAGDGVMGRMLAGRDVRIDGEDIRNSYALLSAGRDVVVTGGRFTNTTFGAALAEMKVQKVDCFSCHITVTSRETFGGIVEAGDRVVMNLREFVNTTTLSNDYIANYFTDPRVSGIVDARGSVTPTEGSRSAAGTDRSVSGGSAVGVDGQSGSAVGFSGRPSSGRGLMDGITLGVGGRLDLSALVLPQGRNAPFVLAPSDGAGPLIETDPRFRSYGTFAGSDYMLNRIGAPGDTTPRRLGDAWYENRLVQEQIFALTGRRNLVENAGPDYDQMRDLMDGGIALKGRLGLTVGEALTDAQKASLDRDVVWMEKRIVDGREVLVPQVYLAANRPMALAGSGALVAGRDVSIAASGSASSDGTLKASANLRLAAAGDVAVSGRASAGGALTISAGSETAAADLRLRKATLTAGAMTLFAGGDLTAEAARLAASGSMVLAANRDVTVTAIETLHPNTAGRGGFNTYNTFDVSALAAGGDLAITAGRDLRVAGVAADVGGSAALAAGRDLDLAALKERSSWTADVAALRDAGVALDPGTIGRVHGERLRNLTDRFAVGRDVTLSSGGRTTVEGATITAGGRLGVAATGGAEIRGVTDSRVLSGTVRRTETLTLASRQDRSGLAAGRVGGVVWPGSTQPKKATALETWFADAGLAGDPVARSLAARFDIAADPTAVAGALDRAEWGMRFGGDTGAVSLDAAVGSGTVHVEGTVLADADGWTGAIDDVDAAAVFRAGSSAIGGLVARSVPIVPTIAPARSGGIAASRGVGSSWLGSPGGGRLQVTRTLAMVDATATEHRAVLAAGSDLSLDATSLTLDRAALIAGGDVAATVRDGLAAARSTLAAGRSLALATGRLDIDTSTNHLSAGDALSLQTAGDLRLTELPLAAGGDLTLSAGGNLVVASRVAPSGDRLETAEKLAAGRDLKLAAGGAVTVLAAELAAGRDVSLTAGGNAVIGAQTLWRESGMRGVNWSLDQWFAASTVSAGRGLSLAAGGDLAIAASDLAAGGTMMLAARGDVSLAAGLETTIREATSHSSGFLGFNSSTTHVYHEIDTPRVDRLTAGGDLSIVAGGDLLDAGGRLQAGGDVSIAAGDDVAMTPVQSRTILDIQRNSSSWWGLAGSSNRNLSERVVDQGTWITASGDLASGSGGDTVIVAGLLEAGGDLAVAAGVGAKARADASVAILAGNDWRHDLTVERKWGFLDGSDGFFWLAYQKLKQHETTATTAVSSLLSAGGDLTVSAPRDVAVVGSGLAAAGAVDLTAGRDVSLTAARQSLREEILSRISGIGITADISGGKASLFAGYAQITDETSKSGTYNAGSKVTAGGDLTVVAGRDFVSVGSQIAADGDAALIAGRDILSLAAFDEERLRRFHEELRIGVTAEISSAAVSTAMTVAGAIEAANASKGAYAGLGAGLAALKIAAALGSWGAGIQKAAATLSPVGSGTAMADAALGLHAGISLGYSDVKSETVETAQSAVVSTIQTGGDLMIDAGRRLVAAGSLIGAGGNASIAAQTAEIVAAALSSSSSSTSSSSSAGIGVGVDLGLGGKSGMALEIAAAAGGSNLATVATGHSPAELLVAGALDLGTSGDLTIAGGLLRAARARIDVGGDLVLAGVQDTSSTAGSSWNAGGSLSVGPGSFGVSLSGGGSTTTGSKAWTLPASVVTSGGLDVRVGGATTVTGALLASQSGDLRLSTASLTVGDLADHDRLDTTGGGLSIGFGNTGLSALAPSIDLTHEAETGVSRAVIGPGTIEIRDLSTEKAQAILARLERDPAKVQEILASESDALHASLDLVAVARLPENLRAIANLMRAWATPVPEDLTPTQADYFRRLMAGGLTAEEANQALGRKDVRVLVAQKQAWDAAVAAYGRAGAVPDAVRLAIVKGLTIDFSRGLPDVVDVECAATASPGCRTFLVNTHVGLRDPTAAELAKIEAAPESERIALRGDLDARIVAEAAQPVVADAKATIERALPEFLDLLRAGEASVDALGLPGVAEDAGTVSARRVRLAVLEAELQKAYFEYGICSDDVDATALPLLVRSQIGSASPAMLHTVAEGLAKAEQRLTAADGSGAVTSADDILFLLTGPGGPVSVGAAKLAGRVVVAGLRLSWDSIGSRLILDGVTTVQKEGFEALVDAGLLGRSGSQYVIPNGSPILDLLAHDGALDAWMAARKVPLRETHIQWGGGIGEQGLPFEDMLEKVYGAANRLVENFKTFDFFDEANRIAVSAKTLNTETAARQANPMAVYNTIKGYVDKMAEFDGYALLEDEVRSDQISTKILELAVPNGTSAAQWASIHKAADYVASKNIRLNVMVTK